MLSVILFAIGSLYDESGPSFVGMTAQQGLAAILTTTFIIQHFSSIIQHSKFTIQYNYWCTIVLLLPAPVKHIFQKIFYEKNIYHAHCITILRIQPGQG
jgi:hypothetical protein